MQKVDVTAEAAEMQVKQAGAGFIRALREERELNLLRERETLLERTRRLEDTVAQTERRLDASRRALARERAKKIAFVVATLIEFSMIAFMLGYWM
nr:MAG TPA: hypothetical protein [Caudoviricetes sp.]